MYTNETTFSDNTITKGCCIYRLLTRAPGQIVHIQRAPFRERFD